MSRYAKLPEVELEPSLSSTGDVVPLKTDLSRGNRAFYRRELLTQQTILQNTLDKLFSELPNELQDDCDVVKLWNDLDQSISGPRGLTTKAGRQLEDHLGDDFQECAAVVEHLKRLLKDISSLIKTGLEEQPTSSNLQAKGEKSLAKMKSLRLGRSQYRDTGVEKEDLEKVLSNIMKARERVLGVAALYQKSFSRGWSDKDTASINSLETEVGCTLDIMFSGAKSLQPTSGEPALSFLTVSLSSTITGPDLSAWALLDTGATASCISEELASDLGLVITPSENEVIWTASKEQKIFHHGVTKLKLSWKSESGKIEKVKVIVYVVPGLALDLILSHDFTRNHPDVWDVADTNGVLVERVAVLGFGRLSKEQRAAEKAFVQDRTQLNRVKDEGLIDAERAELQRRLGTSASNSSARSGERPRIDTSSITESQSGTSGRSL